MMPKISAKNLIGWGPYSSRPNETEYSTVFYKPNKMLTPTIHSLNRTSVCVYWEHLSHGDHGCSPTINYELQMNIGESK